MLTVLDSWGPCAWIIIAEIWPLSTRPYGVSLGASSNWMNNFIVGQVTPDMLEGITYGTYILFGLLTLMGAGFIWFFVPETKRLSLEEMVRLRPTLLRCNTDKNRTSSLDLRELLRPITREWLRLTERSVLMTLFTMQVLSTLLTPTTTSRRSRLNLSMWCDVL